MHSAMRLPANVGASTRRSLTDTQPACITVGLCYQPNGEGISFRCGISALFPGPATLSPMSLRHEEISVDDRGAGWHWQFILATTPVDSLLTILLPNWCTSACDLSNFWHILTPTVTTGRPGRQPAERLTCRHRHNIEAGAAWRSHRYSESPRHDDVVGRLSMF